MIRWLHISDLHLGNAAVESLRMRDMLLSHLRSCDTKMDYIFLTGDIRDAACGGFTPEMAEYILDVCDACGLGSDRLFIVPGNHDVNRDAPGRDEAIHEEMFQWNGIYDPRDGRIRDEHLDAIWKGQEDFRDFLAGIYPADRLSLYGNPKAPHFVVETEDFNILHLDTTVSYTKGQEAHDLIIGTAYLYPLLKSLNRSKPTILLTHYPVTSLLQDEKKLVTEMLQQHGVRVWLAGHEHDQFLQPIQYLQMLQAGEIRYERNASASFLTGEYDPDSYRCEVRAYQWFGGGWAPFPFVKLDSDLKDIYDFELRPADGGHTSALARKAKTANAASFYRLPEHLNRALFPKINRDGRIYDIRSLLYDGWTSGSGHIVLLGGGGMGKSTMLLDFCKETDTAALYISAEQLQSIGYGIEEYCVQQLFDGDIKAYRSALGKSLDAPTLVLIIDGLNEVDADTERRFIQDVQRISLMKGVRILIASRVDFTVRYNLNGYRKAVVQDLEDNALRSFFTFDEWNAIKRSGHLRRLLRNPMLVTIYKEICSVTVTYRDIEFLQWRRPVENATDLFHNYYLAQIALMMKREGISGHKMVQAFACIDLILPAIAYRYETSFSINKTNDEFRDILDWALLNAATVRNARIRAVSEHYRTDDLSLPSAHDATDLLINELHLIHRDNNTTSFSHQMYRDYLSSRFIIDKSTDQEAIPSIWNGRLIPASVATHVRFGSGRYWEGIASDVKRAAQHGQDCRMLISNMFHCFPSSVGGGTADYSGLCLDDILLPDPEPTHERIPLTGSRVNSGTLGLHQAMRVPFHVLRFSDDHRFLAAASGKSISIFNLTSDAEPFQYDIGKTATQMVFSGDYLLINAGTFIVFKNDGSWRLTEEIHPDDPAYASEFKALRNGVDLRRARAATDGIVSSTSSDTLAATAYSDGRLVLYGDGEYMDTLAEGSSILMDAAISRDGGMAVTISFATFSNGRRLQIWDMDRNVKEDEIYCDPEITRIHLSENGRWILGITRKRTWVLNIQTRQEKWIDQHFASNQYNKLITFGDNVIQRTANGNLTLYDLDTGRSTRLDTPARDPRIVCILNNGTVAAVDRTGRYLTFRSERDGRTIRKDDGWNEFIAIQAFSSHPFIVAATGSRFSIYHTGTGQRTRKLDVSNRKVKFMTCHPTETIFAHSDGKHRITIGYFGEKQYPSGPRGWWHTYDYINRSESPILDIAFNASQEALIAIMADGTVLRIGQEDARYMSSSNIITAFSTYAYDFHGAVCSDEISDVLSQNGCL